jgi:DNA-binding CsgD family transcriptional regulator
MKSTNDVATPTNICNVFKQICKRMDFDSNLSEYKKGLIDKQKLKDILILQNQFFVIVDFTTVSNVYVHPNALDITGYSPESFQSFSQVYDYIHPDDKDYVLDFSIRTISITKDFKAEFREHQATTVFNMDFRFLRKDGQCIRLNKQSCCFRTDEAGNMVFGLVIFTDVTHLKKCSDISFSWMEDKCYDHHFEDLKKKHKKNYEITPREKDVLLMLSNGLSATKIAKQLSVSAHTVISHRKHLLHKTKTKNTAELVKFALERSLV